MAFLCFCALKPAKESLISSSKSIEWFSKISFDTRLMLGKCIANFLLIHYGTMDTQHFNNKCCLSRLLELLALFLNVVIEYGKKLNYIQWWSNMVRSWITYNWSVPIANHWKGQRRIKLCVNAPLWAMRWSQITSRSRDCSN